MKLTTDDRKALRGAINVLVEALQQSPEVPEVVHEWPEQDEHLRECLWFDWTGNYFWVFEPVANNPRRWVKRWRFEGVYMGEDSQPQGGPWTRATAPSLPRT